MADGDFFVGGNMKFKGAPLVQKSQRVVKFKKGDAIFEFTISPVRFAFDEFVQDKGIVAPVPPKKPVKVGGKHIRTADNNSIEMEIDENDPEYLKAERTYGRRMVALKLAEVLRDDPKVEFESKRPDNGESDKRWCKYADELADELEKTSLTDQEVGHLFSASFEASFDFDIEKAAQDFLSEEEASPQSEVS